MIVKNNDYIPPTIFKSLKDYEDAMYKEPQKEETKKEDVKVEIKNSTLDKDSANVEYADKDGVVLLKNQTIQEPQKEETQDIEITEIDNEKIADKIVSDMEKEGIPQTEDIPTIKTK